MIRLRIFLGIVAAGLLAQFIVNSTILLADDRLLAHQQIKRDQRPAEILFVGDSSLGNSLDDVVISDIFGRPSLNLALTGGYGLVGSYEMLRTYLARHPGGPLRTVFVVQTYDVFQRQVEAEALANRIAGNGFVNRIFDSRAAIERLRDLSRSSENVIENDYVRQGVPVRPEGLNTTVRVGRISPANERALRQIGQLCREAGLRCFLAAGPTFELYMAYAADYFASLPDVDGLTPLRGTTPLPIGPDELGDTPDHVRPARKVEFTSKWAEALKGYLN